MLTCKSRHVAGPQRPHCEQFSRKTACRAPNETPLFSISGLFHPYPTPKMTRPPEILSNVETVFAKISGLCSAGNATHVPSRMVFVTDTAAANEMYGSGNQR